MSSARHERRVLFVLGASSDSGTATGRAWAGALAADGVDVDAVHLSHLPGRGRARAAVLASRMDAADVSAVVGVGTTCNLASISASAMSTRRPVVVATEHEMLTPRRRSADLGVRREVARAGREYRRADVVTASSHALAAEINGGWAVPASRCLVIPDPVLSGPALSAAPTRPSEGDAGVHIVIAGELTAADDPLLVVAAAGALARRGRRVRLSTMADGPAPETVRRAARDVGLRLETRGAIDPSLRSVAVLGAPYAGLGADLVRAAAAGMPSVAVSTALGVADAVIPGVTGELAVTADPDAVADAVEAASRLEVSGVDEWLDRFRVASSARLLERSILAAEHRRDGLTAASA